MGLPVRRKDRPTGVTDPSKRRAPKQEQEIAAKVGGKLTPGSGSKAVKGDIRIKGVARIEAKCTRKKSFSVTLDIIDRIEDAAASCAEGEIPVIHVEFLDERGRRVKGLYLLREDDAEELIAIGVRNANIDAGASDTRGGVPPAGSPRVRPAG